MGNNFGEEFNLKSIAILGSTGSIGTQALEVIRQNPERFKVIVLTANNNADLLIKQALEFKPAYVILTNEAKLVEVRNALSSSETTVLCGINELCEVLYHPEISLVLTAMVGFAGLIPTLAAIKAGKDIALANKETLVVAGELVNRLAKEHGVKILPVDSEHSAIFQCLVGEEHNPIEKIYLTASGGPFRNTPLVDLATITPDQACAHPNWVMGRKISVDSATMMNKGLEVIEAHWLFDLPLEKIKVLIHPESVVHSMVRYRDGSVMAQLGQPDMRTPIAFGLAWPNRIDAGVTPLNLTQLSGLHFMEPDLKRFPCLALAFAAAKQGGTSPTVLNAANEIAVAAFLSGKLPYLRIAQVVEATLNQLESRQARSIEDVLESDRKARELASISLEEA